MQLPTFIKRRVGRTGTAESPRQPRRAEPFHLMRGEALRQFTDDDAADEDDGDRTANRLLP